MNICANVTVSWLSHLVIQCQLPAKYATTRQRGAPLKINTAKVYRCTVCLLNLASKPQMFRLIIFPLPTDQILSVVIAIEVVEAKDPQWRWRNHFEISALENILNLTHMFVNLLMLLPTLRMLPTLWDSGMQINDNKEKRSRHNVSQVPVLR